MPLFNSFKKLKASHEIIFILKIKINLIFFSIVLIVKLRLKISRQKCFDERAKIKKGLGGNNFYQRADGFFCPPPQAADTGNF